MSDQYKNGDTLIRFGKVYKIFKIKDKKVGGKIQPVIFYKKLFPGRVGNITCSIPVANLEKIKIRKPYSKKEFNEFLKLLKQNVDMEQDLNINNIKDPHSLSLSDMATLMKRLWVEENDPDMKSSFSKRNLFSELFDLIKEEIAHVWGIDLDQAKEKIELALNS